MRKFSEECAREMGAIRGVDHVVVCVHDLDEARSTFARMGFTLTARGRHSVGSENSCIMFSEDYIELLAVPADRPHPTTRYYADYLAAGEGLAGLALASDSAHAASAALTARGFIGSAPSPLARPVDIDGTPQQAAFNLVFIEDGQTPGVRSFVCEHRTREYVWRPEFLAHANGARAIARIELIASNPRAVAAPFARLFDTSVLEGDDGISVPTGGAVIGAATDRNLARRYPNLWVTGRAEPAIAVLTLQVADRRAVAARLSEGEIAYRELPGGALGVGAETAHGIAVVFS